MSRSNRDGSESEREPSDNARGTDDTRTGIGRRTALSGLAGSLALAGLPSRIAAGPNDRSPSPIADAYDGPYADHATSHHPGGPRFLQVGEVIENPVHVGQYGAIGFRDNLAPRLPGPEPDPDTYDADAFGWSIVQRPDGSEATIGVAASTSQEAPRYDSGAGHTVNFAPDVPGQYVFELDAPDGTHQLTVHVFPDGSGPPPACRLDASFDEAAGEFVIEPNTRPAPESDAQDDDVTVTYLADDRDALSTNDIDVDDDGRAHVPIGALGGESARVHAAAYDGGERSVSDFVELDPDGTTTSPNRPPEWMREGVLYQIFPRSWAGQRGETTMADLVDGVEYLDDLGIDAVWLTPVVPAESVARQFDHDTLAAPYSYLGGTLSGGGPHGYDTLDYFTIAPDLVPQGQDPIEAYRAFVDACHEKDIKVVFDLVANHAGRSHPFFQDTIAEQGTEPPHPDLTYPAVTEWNDASRYFDRWARVDIEDTYQGSLVESHPAVTGFFGLRHMPNFNYDSLASREHLLAIADFWSGEVGVDGFRCDIAWGVPRSVWSEVRAIVRENDTDFLMLDETVPKDYRMAENAFGMHFDTEGFTVSSGNVAAGEADPDLLVDDVRRRANEGIAPHALVLNLVENHDEHRLLNQTVLDLNDPDHDAVTDEEWEAAASRQRACWATGVFLPGVPGIYYGQERQISRYGEGRHRGADDPRGKRGDGSIDPSADVRPGGRQRAFMNWEEYDEDHLEFYRTVVDAYHRLDALKPDADLRPAWAFSNDEVLAFGRDASDLSDVDGPERIIAIVNFESSPSEVTVRPTLGDEDLLTGEQVTDQDGVRPGTVLEVDDVRLLSAPDFYGTGSRVAAFEPPAGTDHGPGSYEYPEGVPDGAFDVTAFEIAETTDAYQFRVAVDGGIEIGSDAEYGLDHQHLQVYVRDPAADSDVTEARTGVGASLAAPYQYRVIVDGTNGVRIESEGGDTVAEGTLSVNPVINEFIVGVPKTAFDSPISELELAPLLLGYDSDRPGNVLPVEATASDTAFGGADADTAPNVIDTGLPATFPNEETLAYGDGEPASIPYAAVITEFEERRRFDLPTGDGYGPGTYEVPTGDAYYDAAWDVEEIVLSDSRDAVRIEFTMAAEPENPWGFDPGFSHPFFQIYLHVPGGSPASPRGRTGTNVAFLANHQYRVLVHGEGVSRVENAAGETVSRNVDVALDDRTVTIEFPTAAVDWDPEGTGVGIAPTVMPYDGFGRGSIRAIGTDAGEHRIGGGDPNAPNPAVMDAAVPDGMNRSEVLADYGPNDPARLPFIGIGSMDDVRDVQVELDTDDEEAGDETSEGDGSGEGDEETGDGDDSGGNDAESGGSDDAEGGGGNGAESSAGDDESSTGDDGSSDSIPGFGVGAAITGLGTGAYLLRRRIADSESGDEK